MHHVRIAVNFCQDRQRSDCPAQMRAVSRQIDQHQMFGKFMVGTHVQLNTAVGILSSVPSARGDRVDGYPRWGKSQSDDWRRSLFQRAFRRRAEKRGNHYPGV